MCVCRAVCLPPGAGMNFLAGVLLMYLPSEADAYGALVVLMQHRRMRELYKEDLAWLQARCCRCWFGT